MPRRILTLTLITATVCLTECYQQQLITAAVSCRVLTLFLNPSSVLLDSWSLVNTMCLRYGWLQHKVNSIYIHLKDGKPFLGSCPRIQESWTQTQQFDWMWKTRSLDSSLHHTLLCDSPPKYITQEPTHQECHIGTALPASPSTSAVWHPSPDEKHRNQPPNLCSHTSTSAVWQPPLEEKHRNQNPPPPSTSVGIHPPLLSGGNQRSGDESLLSCFVSSGNATS